jgi:hypothetical protein
LFCLGYTNIFDQDLTIAAAAIGSGLFVSNLTVLLNRQYTKLVEKQHGQHFNYLMLNLGSIIGFASFTLIDVISGHIDYTKMHLFSAFFMLLAWLIFIFKHSDIRVGQHYQKNRFAVFLPIILLCIITVDFLIRTNSNIQLVVVLAAALLLIYFLYMYFRTKHSGYLFVIGILLFSCSTYWLGIAIFHVLIPLIIQTKTTWSLPPATLMMLNPITIIFFGGLFTWFYKQKPFNPIYKLYLGLATTLLSYALLGMAIVSIEKTFTCLTLLSANIIVTAISEYLIGTTLKVYINHFTKKSLDSALMGTLRVFRGAAFTLSFFFLADLIKAKDHADFISGIPNSIIYLSTLALASIIILFFLRRNKVTKS